MQVFCDHIAVVNVDNVVVVVVVYTGNSSTEAEERTNGSTEAEERTNSSTEADTKLGTYFPPGLKLRI